MQYIADIKSGTTPKERDENLKNGIILLKTSDIRNNILQDKQHDYFYIDEKTNNSMKSSQLKESDILINIVGATTDVIGRVSFVPKYFPKSNITQAMSFIRVSNSSYNAETLFIFLQSKYGNKQTRRIARPTGQYNINNEELGSYKIPLFSLPFQSKIETMVKNADQKLGNSKMLYTQAENLLISELRLENFNPLNEKVSIKTLKESFLKTGRLDSEYYQVKYDEYLRKIKLNKHTTISNEFGLIKEKMKSGLGSYHYVEIGDVNVSDGKSEPQLIDEKDLPANAKILPQKGDLLVSKVRPNRGAISIIEEDYSNLVVSGAFAVLREKKESDYKVETLKTLLRTPIYLDWLLKFNVGTSYPVITDEDILSLPIPIIKSNVQNEIASYIKQSMEYSKKAKELLEISTKAVEIAIDKDEQTAHNFLDRQIDR